MPFIDVFCLPKKYLDDQDFLERLEFQLVTGLATAMTTAGTSTRADICHVIFHQSALRKERANHMPWAHVSSGAFEGTTSDIFALRKAATDAVAQIIQQALHNEYNVEVFPIPLDGANKTYLKVQTEI